MFINKNFVRVNIGKFSIHDLIHILITFCVMEVPHFPNAILYSMHVYANIYSIIIFEIYITRQFLYNT